MSLFYRECPCCKTKIHKYLFLTRMVNNGSKDKKNYKSYFCPTCKKQIADDYHVSMEPILGFMIFWLLYYLAKETIAYFDLLANMPFFIKFIPITIFYFLFSALLYYSYLNLKCFPDNEEPSKFSTDNKLIDGMLEFNDDVRITPIEKMLAKQTILSPFYYFIIVIIVTLILLYFK